MRSRRNRSEEDDTLPDIDNDSSDDRPQSFEDFLRNEFPFRDVPDLEIQFKMFYAANRTAYRDNFREALTVWERSLAGGEAA